MLKLKLVRIIVINKTCVHRHSVGNEGRGTIFMVGVGEEEVACCGINRVVDWSGDGDLSVWYDA